jgi:hypothetical protein
MSMLDSFDFGDGKELKEPARYTLLNEGDYRVKIKDVQQGTSSSGNEQYVITLAVDGTSAEVRHYLTILPDSPDRTKWNFWTFWKAFSIPQEMQRNTRGWIGRSAMCHLIVDEYVDRTGKDRKNNKVDRFLTPKEAAQKPPAPAAPFMQVPGGMDTLPFN